jgi:hypothetical protein
MPLHEINELTESDHDYADALLGVPPENFKARINEAQRICTLLEAAGVDVDTIDEDVFIIAALGAYQNRRQNAVGFVQRTRQIARWLTQAKPTNAEMETRSQAVLENKVGELARIVSKRLFEWEGFLLLIFHNGDDEGNRGYVAHASSAARRSAIGLIREYLEVIAKEQAKQS